MKNNSKKANSRRTTTAKTAGKKLLTTKVASKRPKAVATENKSKKLLNSSKVTTAKSKKVTKIVPKTEKVTQRGKSARKGTKKKSLKTVLLEKKAILTSVVVALVLLVAGLGIGVYCASNTQDMPEELVQEVPVEEEPEEPEEPELPTINTDPLVPEPSTIDPATYEVAAYKPKFLSIPSLRAADPAIMNIPIIEVGMWAGNQLGAPTSTRWVGWYYRSAIPGQAGASVMDAHGGALGTGIFKVLPQIKMGAEIEIEMGDGRKVVYVVEEITYKKIGTEADKYMDVAYLPLNGKPTLALITCTGAWLRDLQTYDLRMFVRATLKQ